MIKFILILLLFFVIGYVLYCILRELVRLDSKIDKITKNELEGHIYCRNVGSDGDFNCPKVKKHD